MSTDSSCLSFISLGPTCLPAEILNAGGLRTCSYGFDWCRSGGFFVTEFLRISTDKFLEKYVFEPNLRLVQVEKPSVKNKETPEVVPIDPIYGFNYLYFPHRDYSLTSSLAYFKRCYRRLDIELSCHKKKKVFILADYINKSGSLFLRDPSAISLTLENSISESRFPGLEEVSRIIIVRIELFVKDSFSVRDFDFSVESISPITSLIAIRVRNDLDLYPNQEILFQLISRCILRSASRFF